MKEKRGIRSLSPIQVYQFLPKTNCEECGETNCMAFATRLVNGEVELERCTPLYREEHRSAFEHLARLLAPPVRAVTFGSGKKQLTIGGKHVLHRHELLYHHPAPIAIDLHDAMGDEELRDRIRQVESLSYGYIGRVLTLDAIAVRSVTGDPERFGAAVKRVREATDLPLVLCSLNPEVMRAGLEAARGARPLVYAATKENWKAMAELASEFATPLVVSAPNDIAGMRSLTRTLLQWGIVDLVLDPGTAADSGLFQTIHNFTEIRRAACLNWDGYLGFPILGLPITVWSGPELSEDRVRWKEAYMGNLLLTRYADLMILHSMEGWVLLPQLIWRFNLYTDPRKPVSVEPGLREFGSPKRDSPVLLTTNYALTYFTVESDIKAGNLDAFLIVVDTAGISVESAVAGRYLTAEIIAAALKDSGVEERVDHRYLILPGLAARLSGEVEDATGWRVVVGPKDSSSLPLFIREHWPPKGED